MLILMNYVHWVFKRAGFLTLMLTRLLNLPIIYLVRQQQRLLAEEGLWKSSRMLPQEEGGGREEDERGSGIGRREV